MASKPSLSSQVPAEVQRAIASLVAQLQALEARVAKLEGK